jgi:hypothetical protein
MVVLGDLLLVISLVDYLVWRTRSVVVSVSASGAQLSSAAASAPAAARET